MTDARLRPAHLVLLLPLAGLLAWVAARGRETTEDPAAVLAALKAAAGPALPSAAAAGATDRSEPGRYARDTLHELIDGAAEGYLAKGFVEARAATYSFALPGAPPVEVAAELHRFGSEAGAAALVSAERPPDAAGVPGVAGAVSDGAVLLCLRGRDVLKLTAFAPGSGERLAGIARALGKGAP